MDILIIQVNIGIYKEKIEFLAATIDKEIYLSEAKLASTFKAFDHVNLTLWRNSRTIVEKFQQKN